MSATNHTTNYELPIFVGTDKPAWLVDWNGAMTAIDTAIHTAEGKADQAGTDIGGIESSISTINSTLTSINSAVSQLRVDTNANTGSINTITSLIGNGEPTTTDKTIIGAINELVDDFSLTLSTNVVVTPASGTLHDSTSVKTLLNSKKSIGKIYGGISILTPNQLVQGDNVIATLTNTGLDPVEASYDIIVGYSVERTTQGAGGVATGHLVKLRFNTNGSISVILYDATGGSQLQFTDISLPACLYFLKDLGD